MFSTVQVFNNDIGMEFGIKKCGVLVLTRGKVVPLEGVEMLHRERIKEVEEDGYKYLGISECSKIRKSEMKENYQREYLRRTKLIMKGKLNGRDKSMAMNTWAVPLMRYGAGIVKWTKIELFEIGGKNMKVMTRNNELHLRSGLISWKM